MKCPYCKSADTKVVDKRDAEEVSATRRRRECLQCGKRFTTYERIENVSLTVIKKNGNREQYDRAKLLNGILKACEKRPISRGKMEQMVDDIESELRAQDSTEVASSLIGEVVMGRLKDLDEVAYVRFASVYRQFSDAHQFVSEIQRIGQVQKGR